MRLPSTHRSLMARRVWNQTIPDQFSHWMSCAHLRVLICHAWISFSSNHTIPMTMKEPHTRKVCDSSHCFTYSIDLHIWVPWCTGSIEGGIYKIGNLYTQAIGSKHVNTWSTKRPIWYSHYSPCEFGYRFRKLLCTCKVIVWHISLPVLLHRLCTTNVGNGILFAITSLSFGWNYGRHDEAFWPKINYTTNYCVMYLAVTVNIRWIGLAKNTVSQFEQSEFTNDNYPMKEQSNMKPNLHVSTESYRRELDVDAFGLV